MIATDFRNEPAQPGRRMQRVWAFIATDDSGEDYVIGMLTELGPVPLVTSREGNLERFREAAVAHSKAERRPVRLVAFETRRDIEIIEPKGSAR